MKFFQPASCHSKKVCNLCFYTPKSNFYLHICASVVIHHTICTRCKKSFEYRIGRFRETTGGVIFKSLRGRRNTLITIERVCSKQALLITLIRFIEYKFLNGSIFPTSKKTLNSIFYYAVNLHFCQNGIWSSAGLLVRLIRPVPSGFMM